MSLVSLINDILGKKKNKISCGEVHLITGSGGGKSTSAYGVALRALGHGKKVVIIQFMKGRKDIGEYKSQKQIANLEVKQFGRSGWVNLKNPSEKDKELAREGLAYAHMCLRKKPFLIILDEINLVCATKLVNSKEVIRFLDSVPKSTFVYLTGRYAPKELMKRADFVVSVETKKNPKEMKARKGIEY